MIKNNHKASMSCMIFLYVIINVQKSGLEWCLQWQTWNTC